MFVYFFHFQLRSTVSMTFVDNHWGNAKPNSANTSRRLWQPKKFWLYSECIISSRFHISQGIYRHLSTFVLVTLSFDFIFKCTRLITVYAWRWLRNSKIYCLKCILVNSSCIFSLNNVNYSKNFICQALEKYLAFQSIVL